MSVNDFCRMYNNVAFTLCAQTQSFLMAKNLVIVESPAKAKTIEKFLGPDFKVESSFGHIRDLPARDIGVDVAHDFAPNYMVSADKKDVVKKLKKLAKESDTVWLASDEDREGEAIAWHLAEALELDALKTNRIVFHEITKTAILKAIDTPRRIDMDLVNAQQARRVLDRIVGFELSPVLWIKVKRGLSAGRVQSVAVRLIVEREREIQAFQSESDFRINAQFTNPEGQSFGAEMPQGIVAQAEIEHALASLAEGGFYVAELEKKAATRKPTAPFTTSTLQQEASRKLGFSVNRTMSLAQGLYENGFITYMRTDSVNLSEEALSSAADSITAQYGAQYVQLRKFNTKSKGAQEAHEAIRPTNLMLQTAGMDPGQKRLYDLIWKRTMASQMADAKLERTTAQLENKAGLRFVAKGEMIAFDGFLKVYREGVDEEEEDAGLLPTLAKGDAVNLVRTQAHQRFTRPPGRFTEATLVKALEELGIGRPSTYAPTITTVQNRGYVQKGINEGVERHFAVGTFTSGAWNWENKTEKTGSDKGRLVPTDMGNVVTDFLNEHFKTVMDYQFTAKMESDFDLVADGKVSWTEVLNDFYTGFNGLIEKSADADRASGQRLLGHDPKSGKPVYARIARFGPVVQLGETTDEEKPRFASIPEGQSMETITMEDALPLLSLPRTLGTYEGQPLKASIGKFGPYVQVGRTFVSLPEDLTPFSVTEAQAIALIQAKAAETAASQLAVFEGPEGGIVVTQGRYGPYMKYNGANYPIPKTTEASSLTAESALAFILAAGDRKPARGRKGTSAKKTTAKKPTAKRAKKS